MYECRTSLCPNISTNMVMCFVAIDLFYGVWLVDPLQLCELQLYILRACQSLGFDARVYSAAKRHVAQHLQHNWTHVIAICLLAG